MNVFKIVYRSAQYALLAGAIAWALGHGMLPSHLPYAISQVEMALVLFSIGLPASTVLNPLLNPGEGVQTTSLKFGVIASLALLAVSLVAGMPLAAVSALASLTAIGLVLAGNKLFERVRHLILPR